MKSIEIHSQAEYEANKDFDGILVIKSPDEIIVLRENSRAVLRGNSRAELRGNSSAVLWENSSAVLLENSSAVLWENSSAELRGNSRAVLWENSSAVLRWNSSAVLWENSRAELWENSRAELRGNSSADALDNSSAVTYNDNSVRCLGNGCVKKYITPSYDRSVLDILPERDGDALVLYKCVDPKTLCDYHTGKIEYAPGADVECPDWDPDPSRQCGGGLHLCFSALGTLTYNDGTILKCLVRPEDIVIHSGDISKVRCRKVHVVGIVDRNGQPIEAAIMDGKEGS